MEVKNSRKRFYLMLLLCVGLISASIFAFSFFSAEKVVPSLQSADEMGLDSPYRSGIHGLQPISPVVDRDQNDKLNSQKFRNFGFQPKIAIFEEKFNLYMIFAISFRQRG